MDFLQQLLSLSDKILLKELWRKEAKAMSRSINQLPIIRLKKVYTLHFLKELLVLDKISQISTLKTIEVSKTTLYKSETITSFTADEKLLD